MKHAAIIGTALLLLIPAMLRPPMLNDSFWIDWVWADQFNALLRSGTFYPRWLPLSHGGLGSPVFYFYPPLAFYVAGAFGLLGLSTYATIIAAFGSGLIASGYTMHAWLKGHARHPLLGAVLYMVAPYHLLDFYGRGALAEFLGIAFIPLVALALRDRRSTLLAVAYGGLILSHLPLALLVSLFLIAPYAVYLRVDIRWLVLNLFLGIGLVAVYLIPAFALDRFRDTAALWSQPALQPEDWSLWAWGQSGPTRDARLLIVAIAASMAAPLMLIRRQRMVASYALVCCILALGLIPLIWSLPIIEKVQFPFRILPLAEFAIATGLAQLEWRAPAMALAAIPPLAMSLFLMTSQRQAHTTLQQLAATHPDVPENLPPGSHPRTSPSQWALELAKSNSGSSFYFPSLACGEPPDPATKLVPNCDGRIKSTRSEGVGLLISLLIAVLLIARATRDYRMADRT